jgi:hypothetical protein
MDGYDPDLGKNYKEREAQIRATGFGIHRKWNYLD